MAGPFVSVDIPADSAVLAALVLNDALANLLPLYQRIAATYDAQVQSRFDSKIDPDGTPWPSWAPSTAARRAKQGYSQGMNLLELSGDLRSSVVESVTNAGVTVTVGEDYGAFHEQLDGPGKGIIPRRAFLLARDGGLGAQDAAALTLSITDYFDSLFANLP